MRGLLALAPPPPPPFPAPGTPCTGVPGGLANSSTTAVLADTLNCGRCVQLYPTDYSDPFTPLLTFWQPHTAYHAGNIVAPTNYIGYAYRAQNDGTSANLPTDIPAGIGEPAWPAKLSATISDNSPGCNTPGNTQCLVWKAEPEPLCGFVDVSPANGNPDLVTAGTRNQLPVLDRGFDDPQADPDLTYIRTTKPVVYINYKRADLYNFPQPLGCTGDPGPPIIPPDPNQCIFPYTTQANDARNGNPPWGSQVATTDWDADGLVDPDPSTVFDRHNRGSYASFYNFDRFQRAQQSPNDAFSEPSHPPAHPCDVYSEDCGGLALFKCGGALPCVRKKADGSDYVPFKPGIGTGPPPAPDTWPLVPFPRDWGPYKGEDGDSATAIKRLLRFASSIVSFNSSAAHGSEYTLAEDARNVVIISPGTPIAGSLRDAYKYFHDSVFNQDDPFANCRLNKVILVTDGLESSGAIGPDVDSSGNNLPGACDGGTISTLGPAGDLKTLNVPVIVVAMGLQNPNLLNCIATNSGGELIPANNRRDLLDALQGATASTSTVGVNVFSAPALPAFTTSTGDEAIIGAVIPSHKAPPTPTGDGSNSSWAIWNGHLKAYRLDPAGNIPLAPPTATPTPLVGTPTPGPSTTPLAQGFPDQTKPDVTPAADRRPVWNAGRVLGYTDPTTNLLGADAAVAASPSANAPNLFVWPGRRIVWGDGTGPGVPLARQDFMPNTGTCTGIASSGQCFFDLMGAMSLNPALPADVTLATRTVQFLRGGKTKPLTPCTTPAPPAIPTPCAGSRDEVLTDLGTYGNVIANTTYSYFYQDDIPAGNPVSAQTDGASNPVGYSHKLGDIFHSEAAVVLPPKYFQYISGDVTPRSGACGTLANCSYNTFKNFHSKRRKVVFVGANDGFMHAFDAGVFDRDDDPLAVGPNPPLHPFNDTFDLGTGREIFAYAPKSIMSVTGSPTSGFPSLLNFPPKVQYFVDGSPVVADVFIDTAHGGAPVPGDRTWKTILVSGLRQGGHSYFALDVTQPDKYQADGSKSDGKDNAPDCLDGGSNCAAQYPSVLWEMTDASVPPVPPAMGETWSRPVVGRIKVGSGSGFEDRYVAIFGGGFDANFLPQAHEVAAADPTTGRALYIVNVETGKVLYKAAQGTDGSDLFQFAPMPAPPAVVDVDDDGFLDIAYIGDLNGRMWRRDLRNGTCVNCGASTETLTFPLKPLPFLLYDAMTSTSQAVQPIFLDAGIIFISGGTTPILGIGFGTGYRAELLRENTSVNRFFYVIDPGIENKTFHEADLVNITPLGGITAAGSGPQAVQACTDTTMDACGYFLDFATANEKAVSTVLSTLGRLSLVTFLPDDTTVKCGNGTSFRYSFLYSSGQGSYNPAQVGVGQLSDYQQVLGVGLASAGQSQSPGGDMIDTVLFSGGGIYQKNSGASLKTINQNWKEQ